MKALRRNCNAEYSTTAGKSIPLSLSGAKAKELCLRRTGVCGAQSRVLGMLPRLRRWQPKCTMLMWLFLTSAGEPRRKRLSIEGSVTSDATSPPCPRRVRTESDRSPASPGRPGGPRPQASIKSALRDAASTVAVADKVALGPIRSVLGPPCAHGGFSPTGTGR